MMNTQTIEREYPKGQFSSYPAEYAPGMWYTYTDAGQLVTVVILEVDSRGLTFTFRVGDAKETIERCTNYDMRSHLAYYGATLGGPAW